MTTEEIKAAYDAQRLALQTSADAEKAAIQQNITNAGQTYQPLRDTAYVNNMIAEQRRRENMANMGLSGAGGMSQTLQQRNTGTLLNTLGAVDLQQQGYVDTQNLAKTDVNTAFAQALADIQTAETSALTSQSNWQQSFDASQKSDKTSLAYNMWANGRLTDQQFFDITGIMPTKKKSSGGSSGGSTSMSIGDYIAGLLNPTVKTTGGMPDYIASYGR